MRFRYLFLLISFVLLPVSLVAFDGARPERGGPTPFPHKVHIENGIECTDCHTGARDEDTAGLPTAETCFDCHDTPEDFSPAEKAFFAERAAGKGKLRFSSSFTCRDLKFSHKSHIAKGAECADCHGDVPGGKIIRGGTPDFKHTCIDCHSLMQATLKCSSCHKTYTKDRAPKSHKEASFAKNHGLRVETYFHKLPEDKCFFCHETAFCDACHKEQKPVEHDSPLFRQHHGDSIRFNHDTLAGSRCAVCHDKDGCDACHRKMEPGSHTVSFKNRTHGLTARMDRQSCSVCHREAFCVHCHNTVEPLSHKGQFDRGQQYHCYNCHLPLSANRCAVCHRQTAGHGSLPKPSDATHLGATANSCRVCHAPVPHADNGMSCLACH